MSSGQADLDLKRQFCFLKDVLIDEALAALIPQLVEARFFEEAAGAVLEAMFDCAKGALASSSSSSSSSSPPIARMLRGVVHFRPEGAYQRLFGIECGSGTQVEGLAYVTSGSVWRWIEEHRCSVSIDLQRRSLRSWLPEGPIDRREPSEREEEEPAGLPGDKTRERMLSRDTTHVHVVPLRAPGGCLDGVITLEVSCKAPAGREPGWERCYEELETLAKVAGAFITARGLPLRPVQTAHADEFLPVIGPTTAYLVELLTAFAPREDTILISGPTGSGKSRLARYCHEHSPRKGQRFEVLDILAVPEDLQMAELFGWKRGAFTGAVKDNPGAIARAAKGTLFLDEIDKLSLKAQAGLLHFIEERSYRMLGDDVTEERRANVRLLFGTNADLRATVRAGRFREDLYYRINVLPVRLPPLAERLDELPQWAAYMLNRRHRESGSSGLARFEPEAIKRLLSAPWPGNLRQLDNIVRRSYALVLGTRSGAADLIVQQHHVERALSFDGTAEPSALCGLLFRAAHAFVQEAERRQSGSSPLSLELTDAFRGMVLGVAVQKLGRDEAFAMLGQHALVKNRNHHRALKREVSRVSELLHSLGGEVDPELASMLKADEDV